MTTTQAPPENDEPVLSFTTSSALTARPTLTFMLDNRKVTATAPKAARWARMWASTASGDSRLVTYESLRFIDACMGVEVATWLKEREDDPDDPFDIPDLLGLLRFLNTQFGPLLKTDFETAGVQWQSDIGQPLPGGGSREQRRSAGKGKTAKKTAANKTAARAQRAAA